MHILKKGAQNNPDRLLKSDRELRTQKCAKFNINLAH